MNEKNIILLTEEDLINIWELTGNYQRGIIFPRLLPFENMNAFFSSYHTKNPQEFLTEHFKYNPQVNKTDLIAQFCEGFANKIPIDGIFPIFMRSLPKELKFIGCKSAFTYLDQKYDDFFNQLTDALKERYGIIYHKEPIVKAWISLAKTKKISFAGHEVPHFIYDTLCDNEGMIIKKIDILQSFDTDKAQKVIHDILNSDYHKTNVKIIDAAQKFFEKNGIQNEKKIIPIFEEKSEKLFHYSITFKPEGLMQKMGLNEKEAVNILTFTAYYLAEHAYYHTQRDRTSKPHITMTISTPYEHCLVESRAKYDEALPIILGEFLTRENINKIVADPYDENLAKYLKEYIKTATLKNKISQNILEKPENTSGSFKIKI